MQSKVAGRPRYPEQIFGELISVEFWAIPAR
jgi:hypothetical protein